MAFEDCDHHCPQRGRKCCGRGYHRCPHRGGGGLEAVLGVIVLLLFVGMGFEALTVIGAIVALLCIAQVFFRFVLPGVLSIAVILLLLAAIL